MEAGLALGLAVPNYTPPTAQVLFDHALGCIDELFGSTLVRVQVLACPCMQRAVACSSNTAIASRI